MSEPRKRKWGDRRDGFKVKVPGLQTVMATLMPNRADRECYLNEKIDVTELVKFLEAKNAEHPDYKITLFHCFVMAVTKMFQERNLMNRFVQGGAIYERYDISCAFVAKRRFADHAEEALMFMVPKDTDTIDDIAKKIIGDVRETRKSEHATGGVDELLDIFAAMPRPIMMFLVWIIRCLDFWGINPKFITDGDPNYASIFLSNLGSIKCPAVYHHLNNYGTNSCMITIGTLHKEEVIMPDGSKQIRDIVEVGATIDEIIADGFYFARSLKLLEYLFANPQLLDEPLQNPSRFDYK